MRPIITLAIAAVALLVLTGCGEADEGTSSPDNSSDADPAGRFAGTVRMGAALSETGQYAVEGRDSRQGYDTWVKWVNEDYGGLEIDGRRYAAEIIYYDDESDADTAANLVQKLIDEDRVDFLLGPYSSGLTTGASAIAEANNVIMVEGNGTLRHHVRTRLPELVPGGDRRQRLHQVGNRVAGRPGGAHRRDRLPGHLFPRLGGQRRHPAPRRPRHRGAGVKLCGNLSQGHPGRLCHHDQVSGSGPGHLGGRRPLQRCRAVAVNSAQRTGVCSPGHADQPWVRPTPNWSKNWGKM